MHFIDVDALAAALAEISAKCSPSDDSQQGDQSGRSRDHCPASETNGPGLA